MADSLFADLASLVAFPSVSDRSLDGLAAHLAGRLEHLGFAVEAFPDPASPGKRSLVARIGPDAPGGLTLSGHMDVVPTEGQPWTSDPFHVVERDGRWYGRGTADMKGFFAATLHAFQRLPLHQLRRPLAVVFTHDEEVGCLGSALVAAQWGERRPLPRSCLIGEPTGFRVLRMHPGHVAIEIEVRGKAAHSSRPDLGFNAIEAATDLIVELRSIQAEFERTLGEGLPFPPGQPRVPFNVARIRGGSAINIVPDRCIVEVGFRPPPGVPGDRLFERIREQLEHRRPHITVLKLRETASLLTDADGELETWLHPHACACASPMASFATDGGNLARMGLDPIIFGPGSIEVAHQADEFVEGADLIRAVDLYAQTIHRACINPD